MSSTAISTFMAYDQPEASTRCGVVFCSHNFERFLINCSICSLEFNLLSCNLFIKHIKECVSGPFPVHSQARLPFNQEVSNCTIKRLLQRSLKCNIAVDERLQITDQQNVLDPLASLKLEFSKDKEEVTHLNNENTFEDDVTCLSDYQDEDDLTINKIARRKLIKGIIDEYKNHPILWDTNLIEASNPPDVNCHYEEIQRNINSKFKMNFKVSELRTQIQNLISEYRKVLKKNDNFGNNVNGGNSEFKPKLWYFDQISFIGTTDKDAQIHDRESGLGRLPKQEVSDDEESSDSSLRQTPSKPKKPPRALPNSKILSEPNIISDIIGQYKKYPFLWDQTASLYSDKYARKDAFRKIATRINNSFNKKVTDKEIRRQIINLRTGYRRAQRKMHRANYRISLWYYEELSFIDKRSDPEEQNCQIPEEEDDKSEIKAVPGTDENEESDNYNQSEIDNDHCDDDDNIDDDNDIEGESLSCRRKRDKKIILSLIEEYKQHPRLWNNYLYKTSGRFDRYDAIKEITRNINSKFKKTFTDTEIRNKLVQLRSGYRRVLRKKEAFEKKHANAKRKFHSQLWYFNKMSFIGATDRDFSVRQRKKTKSKPQDMQKEEHLVEKEDINNLAIESDEYSNRSMDSLPDNDIEVAKEKSADEDEQERSEPDSSTNQFHKSLTKNRELLTGIIEEYKKLPCLWAVQYYSNDNLSRRNAFRKMARIINAKFNTKFTFKDLSQEISKLRCTYKRMLRRKQENPNVEFKTKMWYADMLSFIEKSEEIKEDRQLARLPPNANLECEKMDEAKSNEHISAIIELYKSSPVLWDPDHPQHMQWSARRKAIEKIIEKLSQDHDYTLTVEELRYQIRFLRESYFRTVREEINAKQGDLCKYAPKPFFYDQMSFLEQFAEKNRLNIPKMEIPAPASFTEDFAFLTENKPLMIDFIELYKSQDCLWNQEHTDRNNPAAHSDAYDKFINMFLQNDIIFTKEKVMSAISFLYSIVSNAQSTNEHKNWFYEHIKFLENIPGVKDKYCAHCGQYFCTLAAYEKHKLEINSEYPYKCSVCNAGFISRSKYAFHLMTHKEPQKCEQCGFQTFDKYNFNIHMRRHKGIHSFRCEHCEKGFVTSTELNRHLRMHTDARPFICDVCGKPLPSKSDLDQHMKRHRNQRDHKCEFCDSAFFTLTTLRDHMASHSSERQHVCEVCGAAFKRKKTLHQHKALHLERKKHECKICGKLFAQQAGIYSHMKSHEVIPS